MHTDVSSGACRSCRVRDGVLVMSARKAVCRVGRPNRTDEIAADHQRASRHAATPHTRTQVCVRATPREDRCAGARWSSASASVGAAACCIQPAASAERGDTHASSRVDCGRSASWSRRSPPPSHSPPTRPRCSEQVCAALASRLANSVHRRARVGARHTKFESSECTHLHHHRSPGRASSAINSVDSASAPPPSSRDSSMTRCDVLVVSPPSPRCRRW